ncbi:MAG: hypothetical protein A2857_04375 [Candidatus Levybacteria bacterium RIFCSPHIGHO2_01_FULL_36_15]|nr:MAG: hypothetical protein A2857_04375 [Candidatus Levybacteria bacterium RIFCSPHIGHO2_01_FULL_36_15]OGH37603.1 MAG: hypothetical protein A2905_04990 [Candidatus Levybacteria bacterium RIFCSPLOWO2_01_FULL_36_10]
MKITVKVKTKSKVQDVKKIDENNYRVCVKEAPVDGKANKALIKIIAKYFKISSSRIIIISGETSRQKIIEII